MRPTESPQIQLDAVSKAYGDVMAVDALDLTIGDGEFFSMLGPSGSGKTTVLRLIAGFERADSGTIRLGSEDVTALAPFDRDVTTVFQDYALFPHLNVLENVAYGLRVRGVPKTERSSRAREALAMVRLEHVATRKPTELSGGQRQRVALARSIVVRPRVLLLDEPLGALDLKLREQMQVELKQIQRELGITFVFVTHDQEEALTLSDRIAVFDSGRIVQLGTPKEIYERPTSPYVADFVGTSNVFDEEASKRTLKMEGAFALRPEKILLSPAAASAPAGAMTAAGVITESIYIGTGHRVHIELEDGTRLVALEQSRGALHPDAAEPESRGDRVVASWSPGDLVPLGTDSSRAVQHR
ncbi:ABC transporter ATP-binding protein [Nocardioides sp. NBC_00368]|uniref:ABC transporter ATP-binding protein n=1 Tax=Nocardioides sp. NBC_00368 TaxID=2976000 RepID=UPI002E2152BF